MRRGVVDFDGEETPETEGNYLALTFFSRVILTC